MTAPIRLVVVDIDGCLVAVEHASYDLQALARLAELNRRSRFDSAVPPLTILSGRPHPYVDALMQMLDITLPAIFENGAGLALRSPYGARYRQEVERGRDHLARLESEVASQPGMTIQPGKSASLTVFPEEAASGTGDVERVLAEILERQRLDLVIDPAHECVNVLVPGVDKGLGLSWLADEAGVAPAEIAGIGDSIGDLAWLELCGLAVAPANADERLRARVDSVSEHDDIEAVLELYLGVVEVNEVLQNQALQEDET